MSNKQWLYLVSRFLDVAKTCFGYISIYTCESYSSEFLRSRLVSLPIPYTFFAG